MSRFQTPISELSRSSATLTGCEARIADPGAWQVGRMLRVLRRLLGWDSDSSSKEPQSPSSPARPLPRTSGVLAKPKPGIWCTPHSQRAVEPDKEGAPAGKGFDPYKTGAFERSASWEKIAKHKGR